MTQPNDKDREVKPLNCDRDVARWAREFNSMLNHQGIQPLDEGLLIAWFANAMMCGEDTYRWKLEAEARSALPETQRMSANDWHEVQADSHYKAQRIEQLERELAEAKGLRVTSDELLAAARESARSAIQPRKPIHDKDERFAIEYQPEPPRSTTGTPTKPEAAAAGMALYDLGFKYGTRQINYDAMKPERDKILARFVSATGTTSK